MSYNVTYYDTTSTGGYTLTYSSYSNTTWQYKDPDEEKENADLLHRLHKHDPYETDYERRERFSNIMFA